MIPIEKQEIDKAIYKNYFKHINIVFTQDRCLTVMYSLKMDNIPEKIIKPRR